MPPTNAGIPSRISSQRQPDSPSQSRRSRSPEIGAPIMLDTGIAAMNIAMALARSS